MSVYLVRKPATCVIIVSACECIAFCIGVLVCLLAFSSTWDDSKHHHHLSLLIMNMNPMSPLEESKLSMCLSPQDKLKGNSSALSLAQRKKAHEMDLAVVKKEVMDADMDSGWISDDNLRAMDFDESLNQDIDWVVHDDDDLGMSLTMDFAHDSDHDVVNDFGFGPSSFLSPLRGEMLTFEDSSEVSSSFG